jgi:hypothetical protein
MPDDCVPSGAFRAGQVPAGDLYRDLFADRDRLLEEIASRDRKIGELERALRLSAEMIECLTHIREGQP